MIIIRMQTILREFVPLFFLRIYRYFKRKGIKTLIIEEDISKIRLQITSGNDCVILGNGPSLNQFMDNHGSFLVGKSLFCVNAFAVSEYFTQLKPQYYVFADSFYWNKEAFEATESIQNTYRCLRDLVTWKITLFFPFGVREWNFAIDLPSLNPNISIAYFNNASDDSPSKFQNYWLNTAMPQYQTVTVVALFLGLNLGFKTNYLVGVDMSLHVNVFVNEQNIVCHRDQHFYDKGEVKSKPFINTLQDTIKMDVLFHRLSLMFAGFLELEEYANYLNSKVYNLSPTSFIDAFERINLDKV
jgi:hypothetical protein